MTSNTTDIRLSHRVFSRVEIKGPEECWESTWYKTPFGYGRIGIKGRIYPVHRIVFELFNGPIEDGLVCCHKCDNPGCCNPNHLFKGTQKDNVHDMISKKRDVRVKGESHWKAKLTDSQIEEIRKRYSEGGVYQYELAKEFGVSQTHIGKIVMGEFRKEQSGPLTHRGRITGSAHENSKLTEQQVLEIIRLNREGISQCELGRRFGVNQSLISGIVHGKRWSHLSLDRNSSEK